MTERRIRLRTVGPELDKQWDGKQLLRIGRAESFEVVLSDPSVSRRHAEIVYTDHGWVARDLGSTNGTFLNGVRIGRVDRRICERDLLQCGNLVLVVEALTDDAMHLAETPCDTMQVQATTRQSLEQAAEFLALDVTRSSRPGEQLLNLLKAGQYLGRIDSIEELLRQNLQNTITALRARRGAVVLLDGATGKLALRAAHSTRADAESGRLFSQTLATRCFRSGQSLLCVNVQNDPDWLQADSMQGAAMCSVICALLRSPQKPLGVLHLDRGPRDPAFTRDDLQLADALAASMSSAIESAQLLQEKQQTLFIQTVLAFSQVIEMRDQYTGGHTQRVTDFSLMLAEEMNLPEPDRYFLRIGAPLHDIGKIGIDDSILRKSGRLTNPEFEHIKTHPIKGVAILEMIPGLDAVIPIIRNHHERWDGRGYPDRLAGDKIPRLARLVTVADTFDAMTSDRPYRTALSVESAFEQIRSGAGSQFEPACAEAFLRLRPRVEQLLRQHQSLSHTQELGSVLNSSRLLAPSLCA